MLSAEKKTPTALLLKGYGLTGADRVTRRPVEGGRRVARVEALSRFDVTVCVSLFDAAAT